MPFENELKEYLNSLAAKGYAQTTIYNQRKYLNQFLGCLMQQSITDLKAVTSYHIESYRYFLKTELRPRKGQLLSEGSYLNHLNAIHGFFKWLEATGRILITPVTHQFEPRTPKPEQLPNIISEEEAVEILESCPPNTPGGLRDRAVLELFYSTGIRRRELANLNLTDYAPERRELTIRKGKGGKDRIVPVGEYAAWFLEAYLKLVRPWQVKDPAENALFLKNDSGTRLNSGNLGDLVKKALERSGIDKKVTPHTFRHSMATHLLRNGADLRHIQAILGHASLESTQVYTHLSVENLKQAVKKAHPHGGR
jgi:integrase/recombinase XerD